MTGRAWVWIYFFKTSQQSGHAPAACTYKSSLDLCFVGNAHYMRFTCHVSYHLVNTQEQAPGSITDAGNTAAAKGPISSPRATLPGISPAFIQTRSGKVLFPLPECSETLNLPEDCPLSRRGQQAAEPQAPRAQRRETRRLLQLLFLSAPWGSCPAEQLQQEQTRSCQRRLAGAMNGRDTSPGPAPWHYGMYKHTPLFIFLLS